MSERPLVIGKGQCWEVRPGVWQYRHSLGRDPETGKYRHSPRRTIHTNKKSEVYAALEAYKIELNTGVVTKQTNDTVGAYADRFHELRAGTMKSPLAYKREALDVKHINALFGNVRLQELRAPLIKEKYAEARATGLFSENELNKIHLKLKQILQEAVNDELIAKNPAASVSVPRPEPKERNALSVEEASRFLSCLLAHEPCAQIVATLLLLDTGMRRGEALGLTWGHFNEESASVFIAQQFAADKQIRSPKSKMSRRNLSLSTVATQYLQDWRLKQREELQRLGLSQTEQTPIVHSIVPASSDEGVNVASVGFMDPNNYSRWFRIFCVDNGFGKFKTVTKTFERDGVVYKRGKDYVGLTPHELRHTQATTLIGSNVDIKTVQARLGHSSTHLTLDTYSHAIAANDRKASDLFSNLLQQADQEKHSL